MDQNKRPSEAKNVMSSKEKIGFECVRPIESHARLIMKWRNDPETLRSSYHGTPKHWESFYQEFLDEYFSAPDLPPLFVLYEGERAAFLRLRPIADMVSMQRRCCDISINVAPEFRGKGIGTLCLSEIQGWLVKQGYDDVYAEVKTDNVKSQKAFTKAGFHRLEDCVKLIEDTGESFDIVRYLARLTPEDHGREKLVFIIAEAGSNWRMGTPARDLAMAKALIDAASDAGADAVKFQTYKPETIYVANAGKSDYLSEAGIHEEMHDIFKDLAMPYEMIPQIAVHCQKRGVQFMSTGFSAEDFKAVDPYVKIHKIASYEIGHVHLIELAARSGKPTLISTGAATEAEIAWAVSTYRNFGGKDLTLLQCTACYPAEASSLNLRAIPWLKKRFHAEVGLSDHSRHPTIAPVAAVALGAKVIEKHFTLSNSLPGPDHAFAVTPPELKELVHAVRRAETMLGYEVKIIDPSEDELRSFARRGIQALRDIKKGDTLKEGMNIAILRPGKQPLGVYPRYIHEVEGKKAKRDITAGEGILRGDW